MMRLAALVLGLAASAGSALADDCGAAATLPWKDTGALGYSIETHAVGPDCVQAVIVLAVRSPSGEAVWTWAAPAPRIAMFGDEHTKIGKDMPGALATWIETGLQSEFDNTADLPDWKEGADAPERDPPGEFGIFVSDWVGRDLYLEWRAAGLPMFCFVQGMESESCLVVQKDGAVYELGGNQFPG